MIGIKVFLHSYFYGGIICKNVLYWIKRKGEKLGHLTLYIRDFMGPKLNELQTQHVPN